MTTNSNGRIVLGDTSGNDDWVINPKHIGIPEYVWKIIAPLQVGQGVAALTPDTRITAVIIPNRVPQSGLVVLPNGTTLNITNPSD